MEDLTGRQFGHYQIVAPLGEGGMAAVYKAYQPSMERYVAIKVLPRHMASSPEFVARFKREAKLLAQLQHPHILPVFDYGESEGYTYIVMPFVQSGTLADQLRARTLNLPEIRRAMTQLGEALAYAHARGMIHRDIKPSNVLIDERGNCLLTDFGLARMTEATSAKLTSSGAIMGTPAYMSPEQGAGNPIDGRSDIYSLGIIFYETVTGRVPYSAETPIAIVFKHITDPLPSVRKLNPSLPESVELVLLKALAKNPEDRFQKAEDFVHALQAAIPETTVPLASPFTPPARASEPVSSVEMHATVTEPKVAPAVTFASQPQTSGDIPASKPAQKQSALPKWVWAAVAGIVVMLILGIIGYSFRDTLFGGTSEITTTSSPQASGPDEPTHKPPIEIMAGSTFKDDFNQQLSSEWSWVDEDPMKWMLAGGTLQIVASPGSLDSPTPPNNILFRYAPEGDFEITTHVHFAPTSNFQFAGLIIFQDGSNAVKLGRAFCDIEKTCLGSGVYFDNIEDSVFAEAVFKQPFAGEDIYLRLMRIGNLYTGYFSPDGQDWIKVGEYVRNFEGANFGLMTGQAQTEITATFDDFSMRELPSIKTNGDYNCFEAPSAGAPIVTTLGVDSVAQLRNTSVDGNWLYIQNPDDQNLSCWLYFKASALNLGPGADLITRVDTTPTPTPPSPPTMTVPSDREFVVIKNITLNDQKQYVVEYETHQYTEKLPGVHVHFFFNTVPPKQAGVPGKGPWVVYGGPRPFSKYKTTDRPKNASQMCALVANTDHSAKPDSGTCYPLPDVATVTARVDTVCRARLSDDVDVTTIKAGTISLLSAIGQAQDWLRIQNPQNLDARCWVKSANVQINGDASQVPVIDPLVEPTPTRAPTGAIVKGNVYWSGMPQAGFTVQMKEGTSFVNPVMAETTTDAQGNFIITDAPIGAMSVYIIPPEGLGFTTWMSRTITTHRNATSDIGRFQLSKIMPLLLEPVNDSIIKTTPIIFTWQAAPDAARYQFALYNDATGEVIFRQETTQLSVTVTKTLRAAKYQWILDVLDANGRPIIMAGPFYFTIQP